MKINAEGKTVTRKRFIKDRNAIEEFVSIEITSTCSNIVNGDIVYCFLAVNVWNGGGNDWSSSEH